MTYPTPNHEGHYWEVVQVWDNGGNKSNGAHRFLASVPGIEGGQPLDAFEWGPRVIKPAGLAAL